MNVKVRKMNEGDWEKVSYIYKQGINSGLATFQTDCPSYKEWDTMHLKECRFVAVLEELVVGFVALSRTSMREVYKGVAEVSVYLDEAYQKNGIGTTLLNYICEYSEKIGYWSLYSAIISDNIASITLHKNCGFREIGYREKIAKDSNGIWKDTILMERRSQTIL